MKNSEMKTIIRHIDRLTRKLNVKGRRIDANTMSDEDFKWTMSRLEPDFSGVLFNAKTIQKAFSSGSSMQRDIENQDFQSVKKRIEALNKYADGISYLMEKILKTVNNAIKIQRG